jgi:hypothetical protein
MQVGDRDFLRSVISVALAVMPRAIKRAFAERALPESEQAQRQMAESVTDVIANCFDFTRKPPPPPGRGVPARPDN